MHLSTPSAEATHNQPRDTADIGKKMSRIPPDCHWLAGRIVVRDPVYGVRLRCTPAKCEPVVERLSRNWLSAQPRSIDVSMNDYLFRSLILSTVLPEKTHSCILAIELDPCLRISSPTMGPDK